ncbi:hypothetical protein [Nocardia sp. NPDC050175]|uniref:hypothetical protein n=1 Tax=Nocardia sp. NPDC050175 TaxID=3364317 RepID=UPI003796DFB8
MTRLAELSGALRRGRPRGVDGRAAAFLGIGAAESLVIPSLSRDEVLMLDAKSPSDPGVRWDAEHGSVPFVFVIDRARQLPREPSRAGSVPWV